MKRLMIVAVGLAGCSTSDREVLPDSQRYGPPSATVVRPAESAPGVLTLERALDLAERIHPELASARAQVDAAAGRVDQAGRLPNPNLIGRMESAPFRGDTVGEAEYLAGLSQRLPLGGRRGAAEAAETLDRLRLEKEVEVRRGELRGRVQGAFATALFAQEVLRLKADVGRLWRQAVDLVRARRAAGDAMADEPARTEMEEVRGRLEEEKARGLRELALTGLAAAMGDPGLRLEGVEGNLESALELPTLDALLETLKDGAHEALAQAEVEAARARLRLAGAERIPDLTLDLLYRRLEHSGTDAFDVGLTLPLPLFDRNQGRIREAEAQEKAATARALSIRGEAQRQAREAHAQLAEAWTHRRLLREELRPRVETLRRTAEARYAAGDLGLAELLAVRREAAALRLAELDALREGMEAWAKLRAVLRP